MKGISFQNGIEYKITISGERWEQGDTISGELQATAKNQGVTLDAHTAQVILAETTERKLKLKSKEAFKVIGQVQATHATLAWEFKLPIDARITDKAAGLCILYGAQVDPHALGILKLNILPHHYFQDLIELMRTEFRYLLKGMAAGKDGWADAKFEDLILSFKLSEETINVNFEFSRERVDAMKAGLQTKTEKQEFFRSWDTHEFVHRFNDRINKDVATAAIQNVISEYKTAGFLA